MAQVWALSLAVASLAIGMLGVLGVWLCYLFEAVARGRAPPAPPPPPPQAEEEEAMDDDKNGLSEAELRRLGGVCVPESEDGEEEALCPICLDAIEPGRPVRVLPGCNRAFHLDCVDRWLAISPRCPVCNVWAVPPPPATSPRAPKTAWGS